MTAHKAAVKGHGHLKAQRGQDLHLSILSGCWQGFSVFRARISRGLPPCWLLGAAALCPWSDVPLPQSYHVGRARAGPHGLLYPNHGASPHPFSIRSSFTASYCAGPTLEGRCLHTSVNTRGGDYGEPSQNPPATHVLILH